MKVLLFSCQKVVNDKHFEQLVLKNIVSAKKHSSIIHLISRHYFDFEYNTIFSQLNPLMTRKFFFRFWMFFWLITCCNKSLKHIQEKICKFILFSAVFSYVRSERTWAREGTRFFTYGHTRSWNLKSINKKGKALRDKVLEKRFV